MPVNLWFAQADFGFNRGARGDRAVAAWLEWGLRARAAPFRAGAVPLEAVTMPRLMARLQGLRLRISKRQMMRLLISGQEQFLGDAQEVLRAGSVTVPAASFVARATTIRSPRAADRQEPMMPLSPISALPPAARGQADNFKSLSKVMNILGCFSATDRALHLVEICRRTGYPRSTTHRLLAAMRQHGLLDQDGEGERYRLGLKLFELGNTVLANMDLPREARPFIDTLARLTEQRIHLAVFDPASAVSTLRYATRLAASSRRLA